MKLLFFTIVVGFILPLHGVFAADAVFSFHVPETITVGVPLKVTLLIDPQGGSINAISGSVDVIGPANIRRISTSSSIIPLWVSNPTYSSSSITYEGIIPSGFDGVYSVSDQALKPGTLLSFDVVTYGTEPVTITSSGIAYQNDGQGVGIIVPSETTILKANSTDEGVSSIIYSWILNPIFACGIILLLWLLRISFKKRHL